MAKVKIQGNAAGTGVFSIVSPDSDTNRTLTLPDTTGTLLDENSSLPAANLTGTVADARISALTSSKLTGALPAIDGSNLTGIAGGTHDFVASGAIANGKPVILKSDGEVEVVAGTSVSESIPAATAVAFESADTTWIDVAYDPNTTGKFVVSYRDNGNSNYGTAVVGSVSGTTVSFGTPVVYESAMSSYNSIAFDPNTANKCVIAYQDAGNSDYGTAIVGTVSGTSISFGTAVVFESAGCNETRVSYDHNSSANKCAIVYQDRGNSNHGTCAVGTVSGTSISFGTPVVFNAGSTDYPNIAFDENTNGKCLIAYSDLGNGEYGTVIVGQISGTSMTFGSEVVFYSNYTKYCVTASDPFNADKYVLGYRADADSDRGKCAVVTVSTTTPSIGSIAQFGDGESSSNIDISLDPNNANKFAIGFTKPSTTQGAKTQIGTISGTTISYGSVIAIETEDEMSYSKVSFDHGNSGQYIYCWRSGDPGGNYGTARLCQMGASSTNLTTTNFIGTSTAAYADDATATILLKGGISTNQSSLTIGSDYYVQEDGTLATSADTVSVKLGKAISATAVLLSGD